ncbi:RNA polymerase sigma factor [Iodidimonas sp. SYSU 1G8]|uniref:RNA polymerase sigma factor n=1 Tax=Iodidimonas sp. SYSU 1G8 TaxID=3133967 RepID=UPI0031FF2A66
MTALVTETLTTAPPSGAAGAAALGVLSDETLMQRVGGGDEAAYRVLVERHLGQSLGFATRVLGDRAEAEEAMQEAFLKLWRGAPNWQPGGARFTTWFYRVVLNLCIDRQRKRRGRLVPLDDAGDPADTRQDAEADLHERQVGSQIDGALGELPERQRAAISLCYLQGLSNKEAADVLDVNIKALESLLTRARAALKQRLAPLRNELMGTEP